MFDELDLEQQAAALPIHEGTICLITSSNGRRWIVPKGCMEHGCTSGEIALQEAWEEAGLSGVLSEEPIGSFTYEKTGITRYVVTWLLYVTEIADSWLEDFRERRWETPTDAVDLVSDDGLRALIEQLTERELES